MTHSSAPRDRQPSESYRKDDNQKGAEPEAGKRKANEGKEKRETIDPGIPFNCCNHAQREGYEKCNPHSAQRQLQGGWKTPEDEVGYRPFLIERAA